MAPQVSATHRPPPTFTGTPIPKSFADYQKLALQQQQQAQRVVSRDGGIKTTSDGVNTPDKEAEIKRCHFPKLRRVECHERELEEKECREELLGERDEGVERKQGGLKRKAEELVGLFRK